MPKKPPQYSNQDCDIVARSDGYRGFFRIENLQLKHKLFGGGWTPVIKRELFRRGEAVAAVLYDPHRDLIGLVEQFRVGALAEPGGPWCLEVVAGMIEPGETPEQVMRRELKEEANIEPYRLDFICDYLSSPGGSDEKLYLFCGYADLRGAGGVHGLDSENEDIRVCVFDADSVFNAMYSQPGYISRMNNAATLICLQWLQHNRSQLRNALLQLED